MTPSPGETAQAVPAAPPDVAPADVTRADVTRADVTRADVAPAGEARPGPVAFVLKGYPRLSETFIAQEILGLERCGLDIRIVSLRHPTDKHIHPVHREIAAPVLYLPEYLHHEPARVLAGCRAAKRLSGYAAARGVWLRDLKRDPTRNRVRRFGQACVLAAELPADIERLHFHFLHTPASVTRYAALMRDLPLSGSAHAKDIWTSPDWEISEKLAACDWVATCTASGAAHLRTLAPDVDRVLLQYHGLDHGRFAAPENDRRRYGDGSDPAAPVTILTIGRAVAKKGHDDLLDALAKLPADLHWRFVHIGGGALTDALKERAHRLGISERTDWRGAQPQDAVLEDLRRADLFVLASKIAGDGDRDGLPNVLMEAQSQALPVVATAVSAIPELVLDGTTGLLIEPGNPDRLAGAIEDLIRNPEKRRTFGTAGAARVETQFDFQTHLGTLARRFGLLSDGLSDGP